MATKKIGVLLTTQMNPYLQQLLTTRITLFSLPSDSSKPQFLIQHRDSIRAVVCNAAFGADAELIAALPNLEIVASYSVGVDKIDVGMCQERGFRVSNTPGVLTDYVADLGIGLVMAVLRRICGGDGFVRGG